MIKKIRVITQVLFLVLFTLLFYGVVTSPELYSFFRSIHFLTNLSPLPWLVVPVWWGLTVVFLITTFIFGRYYCSFLCPVGFIQDISRYFGRKRKIKKKKLSSSHFIRTTVLFLTLASFYYSFHFYGYFDHLSNLGRVFYSFSFNMDGGFIWGMLFLISLVLITIFYPRLFCLTLCPSGAIYSIFGRLSRLKFSVNDKCNHCLSCNKKCPTNCISPEGVIDQRECIHCYECREVCPQDAITVSFKLFYKRVRKKFFEIDKRRLIYSSLAAIVGVATSSLWKKTVAHSEPYPKVIIPPGGNCHDFFFHKCTSCGFCVESCPQKVLEFSSSSHSKFTGMKPKMNYLKSYCAYECNVCLGVCPSQAISYHPIKTKKQIKIGTSHIDETLCIPYISKDDCGACAEHCPTGAITTELREGAFVPILEKDYCIGCGHCQFVCPVEPKRAIIVSPESHHRISYHPNMKEPQKIKDTSDEDFPF